MRKFGNLQTKESTNRLYLQQRLDDKRESSPAEVSTYHTVEKTQYILTLLAPSAGWQFFVVALWLLASSSFSRSTSLWASSALCVHT